MTGNLICICTQKSDTQNEMQTSKSEKQLEKEWKGERKKTN